MDCSYDIGTLQSSRECLYLGLSGMVISCFVSVMRVLETATIHSRCCVERADDTCQCASDGRSDGCDTSSFSRGASGEVAVSESTA